MTRTTAYQMITLAGWSDAEAGVILNAAVLGFTTADKTTADGSIQLSVTPKGDNFDVEICCYCTAIYAIAGYVAGYLSRHILYTGRHSRKGNKTTRKGTTKKTEV